MAERRDRQRQCQDSAALDSCPEGLDRITAIGGVTVSIKRYSFTVYKREGGEFVRYFQGSCEQGFGLYVLNTDETEIYRYVQELKTWNRDRRPKTTTSSQSCTRTQD